MAKTTSGKKWEPTYGPTTTTKVETTIFFSHGSNAVVEWDHHQGAAKITLGSENEGSCCRELESINLEIVSNVKVMLPCRIGN